MIFEADIKESLNTLRNGGVILYPTDTVWGLGCDATNQSAVDKIYKIKMREEGKSLLLLVSSEQMIDRYVNEIPEIAFQLNEVTDTPLTIIYPGGKNLASGVCADDGSVGIRICKDEFCSELINRLRKPIVSTSANFSGKPAPGNFDEIDESLIEKVDYVVNYRQDDRHKHTASPVIKIGSNGTIQIIRK